MPAHTHDGIDWVARLADLRRADEANGPAQRAVARRLIESLPAPRPTVLDVGCGAGGMSAALAEALAGRTTSAAGVAEAIQPGDAAEPDDRVGDELAGGGTLVLVDAVPELLTAAATAARAAAGGVGVVDVRAVQADLAAVGRPTSPPPGAPAHDHHSGGHAHSAAGVRSEWPADPQGGAGQRDGAGLEGPADLHDPADRHGADRHGADRHGGADPEGGKSLHGGAGPHSGAGLEGGSGLQGGEGLPGGAGAGLDTSLSAWSGGGSPVVDLLGGRAADLVWASNVAHHLPDQRRMVTALASWLAPGGCLALAEGGLSMRCLPWDVGIGEPGLQDRLIAAHGTWFHGMRTGIPGSVRLPVGWNRVLADAGLTGVTAFSYLIDVPAPLDDTGRAAVVSWLGWMARVDSDLLGADDIATIGRLLDPDDVAYVGGRDDIFLLKASTVHLGWRR